MKSKLPANRFLAQAAAVCALAAGLLALTGLASWPPGEWRQITFDGEYVPMVPDTALLMLLLSVAAFLRARRSSNRAARTAEAICALLVLGDATLTMGAKNATVDEAFAARTPGAKPGSYVCVSVADTGTGIPPENLDHIFDPFFTTKEIGQGTGLGLSTVLGIVRGHQDFVQVDSRPGRGTAFDLYFPAAAGDLKSEISNSKLAPPPRGQGELILVVDDEAAVRDSVRRTLETHGYQVVTAPTAPRGWRLFSSTVPRCVLF